MQAGYEESIVSYNVEFLVLQGGYDEFWDQMESME